jgi:hypothetical protein
MRPVWILFLSTISAITMAQAIPSANPEAILSDTIPILRSLDEQPATQDLESVAPEHSPHKAALYSALLPGLGQAYNKKYWKIPLVWGGLAAFGYFISWNNDQYQFYRKNLIYEIEQDPNFPNETGLDKSVLKQGRDIYRRSRDQLALYGILFYILQIVDAHVDAHLMEFTVNQDLSVRVSPELLPMGTSKHVPAGLSIHIKF